MVKIEPECNHCIGFWKSDYHHEFWLVYQNERDDSYYKNTQGTLYMNKYCPDCGVKL